MNMKAVLFEFGITAAAVTPALADRPNVLLIIADDQNIDTVGCYGSPVETPWIDELAKNGVRFSNANVVHTICSPSRYAILTGRYYDNSYGEEFLAQYPRGAASCVNNDMEVEDDGMNLASLLKTNGYYTGYVGKYHLTGTRYLSSQNNWDEVGLHKYSKDADPRKDKAVNEKIKANHDWWCEQVKKDGFDYAAAIYPANLRESFNDYLNAHNVEWTADAAVRFLKERKGKTEPFFLCMATTYPHGPAPHAVRNGKFNSAMDADVKLTGEGYVTDRDLSYALAGTTREKSAAMYGRSDLNEKAPPARWWDGAVGAVLEALKESGQYDNTLVIYISDHGTMDGGKSTLYESGSNIPLIMQWPAKGVSGKVYDHIVGSIDLVPTIFEACGIQAPEKYNMDGRSLLPAVKGNSAPVRDALFIAMGYAYGIKTDDWKYIAIRYPEDVEKMIQRGERSSSWRGPGDKENPPQPYLIGHRQLAKKSSEARPNYFMRNQLYNLKDDPDEKNNLFAKLPEKGTEMQKLLDRELTERLPHRRFGEFGVLKNPELFAPVSKAGFFPER